MPIRERFTQPHTVAVKVGGYIKQCRRASIAVAGRGVGARLPGRSPPRRALRKL